MTLEEKLAWSEERYAMAEQNLQKSEAKIKMMQEQIVVGFFNVLTRNRESSLKREDLRSCRQKIFDEVFARVDNTL